ncbi:MAG TPA: adenosylcobinamide-GDP ribazoletransferase [Oscillospiraceae bacterium]|nr:adenosylcobinamide-GDP ribazoletransferase [Oscillospiraceae bacterium]
MKGLSAFLASLAMYTRIPVPYKKKKNEDPQKIIFNLAFIGIPIGLIWFALLKVLSLINAPLIISAALLTVFPHWMSNFLHLEGFMDSSVMLISKKNSYNSGEHSKNLNAISVSVYLILYFSGIYSFLNTAQNPFLLIFMPILSRELAVILIFFFPAMSSERTRVYWESKHTEYTIVLMLLFFVTAVICITIIGIKGTVLAASMLISFILSAKLSKSVNGITGDTMNYSLCVSEVFGLISVVLINF